MVVTSAGLHAVRYNQAIDSYFDSQAHTDVKAFGTDEYQVVVVAERFQTWFDQPLLHRMNVDKTLTGLAAVQTLSRLNGIHAGKADTFVLDVRNKPADVQVAFEPYYGKTVAPPSDPNLLWDTRHRLDAFDALRPDEIEATVAVIVILTGPQDHGRVYALLDPAKERSGLLDDEDRAGFKDALDKFVRTYAFLAQIVSFGETKLERDYVYCRALAMCLRDESTVERLDLGSEVELTHLRTEATFEGSLALAADTGEVKAIFGQGGGKRQDPELEPLSKIIELLNDRYGLGLGEADQLLFDQFEETWAADPELDAQARNNTLDNFRLVFDPKFMDTVISRMDANESSFKRILDDEDFSGVLEDFYLRKMYRRLRDGGV